MCGLSLEEVVAAKCATAGGVEYRAAIKSRKLFHVTSKMKKINKIRATLQEAFMDEQESRDAEVKIGS